MGGCDKDCSNARQVPTPPIDHRARNIILVDGDFEIDSQLTDQVHVLSGTGGFATVKLPTSPLLGQNHKLVATGTNINVDGNGNPVLSGNTFVPQGTVAEYLFTEDPNNTDECGCKGGAWASCCAEQPQVE